MNHPLPAAKKFSGPFLDNNQPSKSDPPRVAGPRDPAAIDRLRKAAAVLFGAALGIAVYLASRRSDFMTGQTLLVDGGVTI